VDLVHWTEKGWAYRETDDSWAKSHYWAPEVEFYRGKFYMTYSANHTGFPHYGIGYATADKPLGPWVKADENPIAATNADIGVSGPGHSCITTSPDGTEMVIVYHTHADAQKPSGDRVVNIDRIGFDESGKLKITGPTRSPQPMPSGTK
jgi:GH43 family beta-xylosidase